MVTPENSTFQLTDPKHPFKFLMKKNHSKKREIATKQEDSLDNVCHEAVRHWFS